MSYHIYTTDGIILKRANFGEANVLLYILTHDLGLIIASARSVRLSVSKLRPALQEYANISLSCIKGKNGWKVTNVADKHNFFFDSPLYSRRVISQIAFVLMKMIPGETAHPEIFQTVKTGFEFLQTLQEGDIDFFETLLVLRILYELGYVVSNSDTELFLKEPNIWTTEILQKVSEQKKVLVTVINKALKESQL